MVRSLEEAFYTRVSRYTTSAFMRVKLGQVLTRTVRLHIFESKSEAQAFHESVSEGVKGQRWPGFSATVHAPPCTAHWTE